MINEKSNKRNLEKLTKSMKLVESNKRKTEDASETMQDNEDKNFANFHLISQKLPKTK